MRRRPREGPNVEHSPFSLRTLSLCGDASRTRDFRDSGRLQCVLSSCSSCADYVVKHPGRVENRVLFCEFHAAEALDVGASVVEVVP